MIGNLDYIIDNVSTKYNLDRRLVEVIAQESFKRLKSKMTSSEAVSLLFPGLGYWCIMNRKLRNYTRQYIKKLRKAREKLASGTLEEAKIPYYKELEAVYTERVRTAWIQMDAMRYFFIHKDKRIKASQKRNQDGNTNGVSKPYTQSFWKSKTNNSVMDNGSKKS